MAAPNRTFEARVAVVNNRRRLMPCVAPAESLRNNAHDIVGQRVNRGNRQGDYPYHHYNVVGDNTSREIRMGPMMYAASIQKAFDYYGEGIRYAAQRCTYAPYPDLLTQQVEVIHTCAAAAARGALLGTGDADILIHLCGNGFAIGLPDSALYTEEEANAIVLSGFRYIVQFIDEEMRATINQELNNPAWNTAATAENMPAASIPDLVPILAVHMSTASRQQMMNAYMGIFLAYTQQGNITARKLTKIARDLATQNIIVTVTSEQVRNLWNIFGPYFDDDAAGTFFPYWEQAFTGRVLRMKLLMQQVANAGLTGLMLIRTALRFYPDFRWELLAHRCPQEWQSFMDAHQAVGDNIYYGFRKDLGVVGVRNYQAIAYAAKKLHQDVMGDQNMLTLQTLTAMTIPEVPYIDQLVRDFHAYKRQNAGAGDQDAVAAYFGDAPPGNFLAAANLVEPAAAPDIAALLRALQNPIQDPRQAPNE